MSKTDTPFFSLGSQGTVGGVLTTQKKGQKTLVREKPIPAYRRTLPQVYQRWLYEDYAYLWRQQTEATRREYAAGGSHWHLTGFQYWMKYHLTNLPDIAGMWHLDEKAGAIAYDSSKQGNNGTIVGASPTYGVIDGAQLFDGINDTIIVGTPPSLAPTKAISIECFVIFHSDAKSHCIVHRGNVNTSGFVLFRRLNNNLRLNLFCATGVQTPETPVLKDTLYHVEVTYLSGTGGFFYLNGLPALVLADKGDIVYPNDRPFSVGFYNSPAGEWYAHATIDHLIVYNRPLDQAEVTRHSERRFPA